MPELPEVETTVRDLSTVVVGSKIKDLWTDTPKRFFVFSKEEFKGKKIISVERRGKNIIINLTGGVSFLIHQKIAGHLLIGNWSFNKRWIPEKGPLEEKVNSYIHFIITLNNGMIALSDPRKFAKIEFWDRDDLEEKLKKELGPDALIVDRKEFKERISQRKSIIKTVLLNQAVISGIGNIYSDEILWDARINPYRRPESLSEEEKDRLYRSTKKILKRALVLKGDSMSDYRLIDGTKGGFQEEHKVYGREGLPCYRKDGGVIERKKIGNRSLRFCPVCQK